MRQCNLDKSTMPEEAQGRLANPVANPALLTAQTRQVDHNYSEQLGHTSQGCTQSRMAGSDPTPRERKQVSHAPDMNVTLN